jgi:hypothetical protein
LIALDAFRRAHIDPTVSVRRSYKTQIFAPRVLAEASRKLQALTGTHAKSDADAPLERLAKSVLGKKLAGGEGQNRTVDTVIFSHVLYQLSYLAPEEFRAQKETAIIARDAPGQERRPGASD